MNKVKAAGKHFIQYVKAHKIISVIALVIIAGGGWFAYAHATSGVTQTRYVLGTVSTGTIISTVSESGQVSASRSIDIKPSVTGTITYIGVKAGQQVKQGQLLAEIDPTDAEKSLHDAQTSLETAQLNLQKLQQPATTLTLTQAQNALSNAQDALATQYTDSQNDYVGVFLALPSIMINLQSAVIGTTASKGNQWNIDYYQTALASYSNNGVTYRNDAYNTYTAAEASYNQTLTDYKALGPSPTNAQIAQMTTETYNMLKDVSAGLKSANSFLQFYEDTLNQHNQTPSTVADTGLTNMSAAISTTNSELNTLNGDTNGIKTDTQNITEQQLSLQNVQSPDNSLDVRSDQINIEQAQNAVQDAQNTLAKYYLRAPFDGMITVVNSYVGDDAGSTAIATLITPQQIIDLSLNEVDAAKVKVGDKATLTFDAVDGLSLTGTVAEIDPVGTVSQGVVSYGVQVSLDTQNDQVKPGMTVNATIQTQVDQNVLTVPSSAVKTVNGQSVVQVFTPALTDTGSTQGVVSAVAPSMVPVETGISDNTNIEITSGLTDGEQIVVSTRSSSVTTASSAARTTGATTGATRATGAGGFGGGAAAGAIRL